MRAPQLTLDLLPEEELNPNIVLLDDSRFPELLERLKIASTIGIDLETQYADHRWKASDKDALCPFRGTIRLIQVALQDDLTFIIDLGAPHERQIEKVQATGFLDVLKERLYSLECKVITHNGYFESAWLYYHFGFKIRNIRDTLLMSRMIYAGTTFRVKHNLGSLFERYLGLKLDKSQGKEFDWRLPLKNKQLNYAYHDAALIIDLFYKLKEYLLPNSIFPQGFVRPVQAECEVVPIFAEMAINGYPIDANQLEFVYNQHEQVYNYLLKNDFYQYYPSHITHSDTTKTIITYLKSEYKYEIKYNYQAIQELPKDKRPSIKEILYDWMDKPPIAALFRARKLKKILDYLNSIRINTFDGCVHTSYTTIAGECTGRSSSSSWISKDNTSGMNIQNPGKRLEEAKSNEVAIELTGQKLANLRTVFAAPNGYKLIIIDLPQAHYMIATESSGDKTAKAMFKDKIDQHSLVGANVAKGQGYEEKYHDWKYIQKAQSDKSHPDNAQCKKFRKYGKVGNYSQLNGSGSATMHQSNRLGIEANDLIRESWKSTFSGISRLMYQLVADANFRVYSSDSSNPAIANFFKDVKGKWGLTYGFDGRPYWLPMKQYQQDSPWKVYPSKCYASHWLTCEKTIMAWGMVKMQRYFDANLKYDARFVNMAHDEVNIIAKEEYSEEVAKVCNDILYKEFIYYIKDTQVNWDDWKDSIGSCWADK